MPPKLNVCLKKNSLYETEKISQRHFCQVRLTLLRLYPCSITGAPELGYLCWARKPRPYVHLFNSKVHSVSALLPRFQNVLLGSLEIALKRTRPRQSFLLCWAVFYDGEMMLSRGTII